jgi:hypothetical protein
LFRLAQAPWVVTVLVIINALQPDIIRDAHEARYDPNSSRRIHLRRLSRIKVTRKTNAIDLVTEADQESEQEARFEVNRLTLERRLTTGG